jgi:transposase
MPRQQSFIKLTPAEEKELNLFLAGGYKPYGLRARRRAQTIWFSQQGMTVSRIAQRLHVSERHIWKWRKTYKEKGLTGLKGKYVFRKLGKIL